MARSLDNYILLGNSGLRVSPFCLGTMTFGTEWGWGSEKEEARKIFDIYVGKGGNFLDTANNYTNGTSEKYIGEFMHGKRDQLIIATKYTSNMNSHDPNAGGNHRKNMRVSVEKSLRRLKTDYIDLYWVHAWEFRTPIEEVMRGLDDLVTQGKILYIGVSDTPSWKIAEAQTLSKLRGWTPFVATQVHYNLIERTPESDLVPMGLEMGIAIQPWSPLAGGVLSGKYSAEDLMKEAREESKSSRLEILKAFGQLSHKSIAISEEVKKIAREVDGTPSQVSLNWLLNKPGVASPIIGARTEKQLQDNIGALDFDLTEAQMTRLDNVSSYPAPFPANFLGTERIHHVVDGDNKIEGGFKVKALMH
ncbi:MAG: aldo/keto reductase [Waddliaceae bacterium]